MTQERDDGAWFAPKRYGIGSGWPIAWQGWASLAAYIAAMLAIGALDRFETAGARAAAFTLWLLLTGLFMVVIARRTRGGWKWRWGNED